eukprot:CAMPEP_0168455820 /NCGR_PEP_ID=MMETSP0228-20121227/50954_1 /TAXON_ID=133427 /ORGANISM="Protoceratium reticulatum, Strain CCCM 535 (=CCMP 1889)" /LENGTH=513 /DNA_ID=CAMNT_0008470691 /DNA_START=47 /DNA_END=1585 /DNA_ORIENTATION=+
MEQYETIKTLGRGAFGTASLAKLKTGGRRPTYRVIKQVDLSQMTLAARAEVLKEVGVLRQLSHPHIVRYYEEFEKDNILHIVMEFADGGDLSSSLKQHREDGKPFSEGDAMAIFGQSLLALRYIHRRLIVHRDIKCQNIFRMTGTGDVKLGDFGISKVMEHTAAVAGTVIGTPAYLAPEVCENAPYNSKVDIWSMGVVLYELLALEQPFQATSMPALVMRIVMNPPPPLPETCSDAVKLVVDRALQKGPDNRPSADELLKIPVVQLAVPATPEWTESGMEQFEELETLGRGAFGVAMLVRPRWGGPRTPLRVVKKVDLTFMPEADQKGAEGEVSLLRRLAHQHIIAYFDHFMVGKVLHIVLEFADGGDLSAALRRKHEADESFPEKEAMTIFGHCLLALHYIHGKNILHRDLKTQNIFLMKSGEAKLGDFGISKVLECTAEAGTLVGTPSYLAPEVIENSQYGSKVDIWSLGVVLYEVMAMKQPFHCSNMGAIVMKIMACEPPALPSRCSKEA